MLKARILTAVVLFIGFTAALFEASNLLWAFITLAVTLIAVWEWSNLIRLKKSQMLLNVLTALSIGLLVIFADKTSLSLYIDEIGYIWLGLSSLFWLLFAPIILSTRKLLPNKLGMAVLGLLLLIATWMALNGLKSISPKLLLSVLAVIWLADIAAYFAGKKFGHHKLAPEISPGKTWEGVAGAMFAVTAYGLFLCDYMHISHWLIVGLWLIAILSVIGDLFESLLKRQAGKKDSSHLLPGHGGVLDRIDGLISTLPLALFFTQFPLFAPLQLHA